MVSPRWSAIAPHPAALASAATIQTIVGMVEKVARAVGRREAAAPGGRYLGGASAATSSSTQRAIGGRIRTAEAFTIRTTVTFEAG